jgi:hypothetical protein
MHIAEEVIHGDPTHPHKVFQWDKVELNLPGSKTYDPSHPCMAKYGMEDGHIAANLFIFVEDLHHTGTSKEDAWQTAGKAASTLNYLGVQDAPQKR